MLSGGADSMALLDIVRAVDRRLGLGLELSALHVDYATRGAASARDRQSSRTPVARSPCRCTSCALRASRPARGFQERARRIRYDAARAITARGEADVVVTAHNRDDQAETVLYRLVKYAAPSSLRAMRPREDGLARPLLCLGAAELRAYCRELGIVYGRDESNETVDYRRNLVRHGSCRCSRPSTRASPRRSPTRRRWPTRSTPCSPRRSTKRGPGSSGPPPVRRRPSWALDVTALSSRDGGAAGALPASPRAHRPGRRGAGRPPSHPASGAARRRHGRLAGRHPGRRARGAARVRPAHGAGAGGHARVPARRPCARVVDRLLRPALSRRPHCRRDVREDDRRGLARRRAARLRDRAATPAARRPAASVRHDGRRAAERPVRGAAGCRAPGGRAPWWPNWTVASPGCARGAAPNGSG